MESVGGMAVIEGVMMKHKDTTSVAVRNKDGKIITKIISKKPIFSSKFFKLPFIRGIASLFEMLFIGMKTLIWSSDVQLEKDEKLKPGEIIVTIIFSILFSIGLFVIAPYFATFLFTKDNGLFFNLIDGLIRIVFFISYLLIISSFSDIRRVFEYHGAEHKVVNCYENNQKLTVANCKKFSTFHARCGTSFIFVVMVLSIVLFSLIKSNNWQFGILIRILLIPIIAASAYEIIKILDKFKKNPFVKLLILPGKLLQRVTTKTPSNDQIEVAIKSLNCSIGNKDV